MVQYPIKLTVISNLCSNNNYYLQISMRVYTGNKWE